MQSKLNDVMKANDELQRRLDRSEEERKRERQQRFSAQSSTHVENAGLVSRLQARPTVCTAHCVYCVDCVDRALCTHCRVLYALHPQAFEPSNNFFNSILFDFFDFCSILQELQDELLKARSDTQLALQAAEAERKRSARFARQLRSAGIGGEPTRQAALHNQSQARKAKIGASSHSLFSSYASATPVTVALTRALDTSH